MRVFALIPYPLYKGPSQRFRLGIFIPYFKSEGINFHASPFYSEKIYSGLYKPGRVFYKASYIIFGFIKRIVDLFKIVNYDLVLVQREITPIGPPVFMWIITKVLRKKVIYDFDDAIWMPNYSESNAAFHRLKAYWKTKYLIKWSDKVLAGNKFLLNYSLNYNSNSYLIPTVVDTVKMHNPNLFKREKNDLPMIGWTGSHSTMHFLNEIFPILDKLYKKYDFTFRIISNRKPEISRDYIDYKNWSPSTEVSDLVQIELGIMPLKADFEFAKGKCGFKIIQYLSLGKIVLATGIGVNSEIVEHEETGYICNAPQDWEDYLEMFLKNKIHNTGQTGKEKIEKEYSVNYVFPKILECLT